MRSIGCALAGAGMLAASAACQGALVKVTFSGTITSINEGFSDFPPELAGVVLGDTWEFSATFDTATHPDGAVDDATFGAYELTQQGEHALSLRLGSVTASSSVDATLSVYDGSLGGLDGLSLETGVNSPSFWTEDEARVSAEFDMGALLSDAVPGSLSSVPVSGSFVYTSLLNLALRSPARMQGDVTLVTATVVPAPGGAALLGLAGLAAARRRR